MSRLAALDRLLQRCLAKDPDDRWQSARDLKAELEWIASSSGEAIASSTRSPSRFGRLPWIAAAVLAVVAVGLGIVAYRATRPAPLKPLVRLDVDLGAEVSLSSQAGADTILSPDGTRLVYVSQGRLFTRRLDQPKATELAGTDGAFEPFFSPDGQWVAFFASGKVEEDLGGRRRTHCVVRLLRLPREAAVGARMERSSRRWATMTLCRGFPPPEALPHW